MPDAREALRNVWKSRIWELKHEGFSTREAITILMARFVPERDPETYALFSLWCDDMLRVLERGDEYLKYVAEELDEFGDGIDEDNDEDDE